jgi:hypothetical protein
MHEQERKILRWAIDFFFNLNKQRREEESPHNPNDENIVDEEREGHIVGL